MKQPHQILFLACLLAAGPAAAQSGLEGRVARLERILASEGPSELLLQVQRLQQEVQELRGLVESQQFSLERVQRQQRDQYLDMDARLGSGQDAGDTGPSGGVDMAVDEGSVAPRMALPSGGAEAARQPAAQPGADPRARVIPVLPSPETTAGGEREAYQAAFDRLKERRYDEAITAFNDLLRSYPQGQYTPDALFWLGETYYVTRDYDAAIGQYDRLIAAYPQSARLPSAMLKAGYIHDEQGRDDAARAVLEEVVARYPNSTEARLAKDRLRRMDAAPR